MAWPQPTDYNEAIQNPRSCFGDPELQAAEVVADTLGMPRPYSGNFADVYQFRGSAGQAWAVKCFTREVGSLQSRYQAISHHLRQGSPPFMVQFQYLTNGIRIRGNWYPVLKMNWVEGFTLNDFVRLHADKPLVMYRLAKMWVKLSLQLRRANMAHADLQHGNVILVPGEKASQLSLRLIDYDGMHVPALAKAPSGEVGHPNYQHPQRLREGLYNSEVDRFPHLVIYIALRCLTVGGRELWEKHDNGENLLFREQDFSRSTESQLLLDLWQLPDPDIRRLLGHLLLGSQMALDRVVMLDEIVGSEGRPLGLTGGQERHLQDLLPPGAARMKIPPATVSKFSLEELLAEMEDEPLSAPAPELTKVAVAESAPSTKVVATVARAQDPPESPNGHTGLLLPALASVPAPDRPTPLPRPLSSPGRGAGVRGGALLFPWLQWRCSRCGEKKHVFESICPHCRKVGWTGVAGAAVVGVACLILAFIGLANDEPGMLSLVGGIAALLALVAIPLATGLLVNALLGDQKRHADALPGLRWPAANEICPRCGEVNFMPLFCCRHCGRLSWVWLAEVCAFAITAAAVVAISVPDYNAPAWWKDVGMLLHLLGALLAATAAFAVFIGTAQVWQLQPRLPKEGRVFRSKVDQMALVGATLVPVLCTALLVLSLF